ncbi:MAG: DNA-3-methyladenine glycosylase [Tissierellia bacterium]|nr:DNA-3-methyladenine glycosylase [Tissierellia bacterium]
MDHRIRKLNRDFFQRDTLIVAKELLGKVLCRRLDHVILRGRIVETEGYLGLEDKAAHTFTGKITNRNRPLWGEAGHGYIYFTYGIHHLCNIVTEDEGIPNGVLLRALEPMDGISYMADHRFGRDLKDLTKDQKKNLTNGPAKLAEAMNITSDMSGIDIIGNQIWVEDEGFTPEEIVETTRIGIDYSEEAIDYPYRFYIKGNPWVSKQ